MKKLITPNKPTFEREERSMTEDNRKAMELLKQSGECAKPYMSEILGSISFHLATKFNHMLGRAEIHVVKIGTEMNMSQDVAKVFASVIRDESLAMLGMKMTTMRPSTVEEKEQKQENVAKANEGEVIQ